MSGTLDIFGKLRDAVAAVKLNATDDEPLFETVLLHPNKKLIEALRVNVATKKRVCLVVPLSVRRHIPDDNPNLSVNGRKLAEVVLIYSDQALFYADKNVAFGGDKNPGLFAIDDALEAALLGLELTPGLGGILLGDSDPLLLTDSEQKNDPGRHAWIVQLIVPTGNLLVAVH
ncbi:MAG: hypothetical protein KGL39_48420 [Patescibacteria group bacterium]|nr:hypothetical protein [Patescibacteria group bacterium]